MLRKMDVDQVPDAMRGNRGDEQLKAFLQECVDEFVSSGCQVAEIEGWPNGDPKTQNDLRKIRSCIKKIAEDVDDMDVRVITRKTRVFLVDGSSDETDELFTKRTYQPSYR